MHNQQTTEYNSNLRPRSRTDTNLANNTEPNPINSQSRVLASLSPRGGPQNQKLRRTLSAQGKKLFVQSYGMFDTLASPQSPFLQEVDPIYRIGSDDKFLLNEPLEPVDDNEVVDDGWSTVPTKKDKAKQREQRKKEREVTGEPIQAQQSYRLQINGESDEIGDAIDLYYDERSTRGRRQYGSAKKTQQFKAALKRSYAMEKRDMHRRR